MVVMVIGRNLTCSLRDGFLGDVVFPFPSLRQMGEIAHMMRVYLHKAYQ